MRKYQFYIYLVLLLSVKIEKFNISTKSYMVYRLTHTIARTCVVSKYIGMHVAREAHG